jgi:protein-tyrosine phosphatase
MGLPSEGIESIYRNPAAEVAAYLNSKHKNHYIIINLSQLTYNYDLFNQNVIDFGFPDHHSPPLHTLFVICHTMKQWLDENEKNVVAVHCKVFQIFRCLLLNFFD